MVAGKTCTSSAVRASPGPGRVVVPIPSPGLMSESFIACTAATAVLSVRTTVRVWPWRSCTVMALPSTAVMVPRTRVGTWASAVVTARPMSRLTSRAASRRDISGLLEGQPLHVGHVGALDADQLRRPLAARGVDVTLVVDVGVAGLERVAARVLHLTGLRFRRRLEHCPVAHDR